jgi:hypothetical protein
MIVCEFCLQYQEDGRCAFGLNIPSRMSCREFDPSIERFCANPSDFVSSNQIIQMSAFFRMKGTEMKKIKLIATREEKIRSRASAVLAYSPAIDVSEEEKKGNHEDFTL